MLQDTHIWYLVVRRPTCLLRVRVSYVSLSRSLLPVAEAEAAFEKANGGGGGENECDTAA
jgi:hypothetical protein